MNIPSVNSPIGTELRTAGFATSGWFGFSADPPTLAHRKVIEYALGTGLVEKVIVFPAGPLKYKKFQASTEERLEMTKIFAMDFPDQVIVEDFDLRRETAMTWFDLWQEIIRTFPEKKHYLILGSDQYDAMEKTWYRGEELKKIAKFMMVPRMSGSSTEARAGDFSQLSESIQEYIRHHHVYS